MEEIIGDYQSFFTYIYSHLNQISIDIKGLELSHLMYRVATFSEYEKKCDQLKKFSSEYVETVYNGRPVSVFVLAKPLQLVESFSIQVIELPAPREAHKYPTGLEFLGIKINDTMPEFKTQYKNLITRFRELKPYSIAALITFENGTSAKFYEMNFKELIILQGWKFEKS